MTARYHATDTWMNRNGLVANRCGASPRYYEDPAPGEADSRSFRDYVGTYELAPEKTQAASQDGGHLFLQRGDRPKAELIPEAAGIFFRKGVEGRILFRRDHGKVQAVIDRRSNEDVVWKKVR
jgi:hypothetical protein